MDDAAGTDFSTYKEIGIELVSPSTGIKYYKPVANSSSKPVVGMCFDSVDEAFEFYKQCARSSVTHLQANAIDALSAINIGPVKTYNIWKCLYGGFEDVGATKSDLKNYKRDFHEYIGEHDADMMLKRLLNKMEFLPNFTCHYTIKEDGRYEMVFVPFTCIDNHNRNVTVGAALLGNETADSYRWLLLTFLSTFGAPPQVVATDQDAAMKRAIKDVLPRSRHRLCMWHIWDKITSKVGANLCGTTDFKKRLGRIVWDDSIPIDEFERQWPIILSDFNLSEHEWLGDIYNIRHDWIPAYYKDEKLSGLMRRAGPTIMSSEIRVSGPLKIRALFFRLFVCIFLGPRTINPGFYDRMGFEGTTKSKSH
ncbi:hypothetical protein QVD17_34914 [Tagetes erecta]|uniref:MULE transposase domain-containing protein n=1 Tax=Tagetes erecta TaxID=13708 RepID=A0AAD8NLV7_TARER|nr:hypothetical protein QVD17_34914 [Tagetes erecta]